ncbi:MAG: hypothetical protein HW402_1181 [Dehalococcoidales bacterium]|nr:hypothetical protein [Dehalococcoidales bacterium]
MKNVTDLTVTQIRIFPVDVVPLSVITTKSCVEKIREILSIGEVVVGPSIVFRRGELRREKRVIVTNKIEVDPRRVIVEVEGTSKDGTEVYEAFLSAVAVVANADLESLRKPLLIAENTQCIVSLDFTFESLFSEAFIKFLNSKVKKEASSKIARASVRPLATAVEITYEIIDKTIIESKITMNPKQLHIAPRPGAPLDTRKYLISSPFNSDTHLKLVNELNKDILAVGKVE